MPRYQAAPDRICEITRAVEHLRAVMLDGHWLDTDPEPPAQCRTDVWRAVLLWTRTTRAGMLARAEASTSPVADAMIEDAQRWAPFSMDAMKSSLLGRILCGGRVLDAPPPLAYGYPWYDPVDHGSAMVAEGDLDNVDDPDAQQVGIAQHSWTVLERDGDHLTVSYAPGERWLLRPLADDEKPAETAWRTMGGVNTAEPVTHLLERVEGQLGDPDADAAWAAETRSWPAQKPWTMAFSEWLKPQALDGDLTDPSQIRVARVLHETLRVRPTVADLQRIREASPGLVEQLDRYGAHDAHAARQVADAVARELVGRPVPTLGELDDDVDVDAFYRDLDDAARGRGWTIIRPSTPFPDAR